MSSKNRVNPDHYKVAGRDPQGETIQHDRAKQMLGVQRSRARNGNLIPGRDHPVGAMSAKQGMASGSQKAATSHYGTRAMPATRGAAGAFGREDARGSAAKRKGKKTTTTRRTTKRKSATRGKSRRAA
jgi:hypothetical protein